MITIDDKKVKGHTGFLLFIDRNTAVCFNSFLIEYISQEILNKIKNKSFSHKNRSFCFVILIYFLQMIIKRMAK